MAALGMIGTVVPIFGTPSASHLEAWKSLFWLEPSESYNICYFKYILTLSSSLPHVKCSAEGLSVSLSSKSLVPSRQAAAPISP